MLNTLMSAATATSETTGGLETGTWALIIGGGVFLLFMLMLLVTVSFSNVGLRHTAEEEVSDSHRQHTNKHGHH
ncbi:hypothetical protein [Paeniglutamicibacter cryotolerans]|uniref:Uncharacterized protein n=1 Tax=Paeniglutamicibacter cryotolerans TaxID=670079 RepID=A0A839QUK5_9MICC|nr:hypothetical protein [Paeniglutamicibacter cryotolerans]MBB2996962.1 hypothetical protein [Paeniglutamicibacter cryotolerans]